MENRFRSLDCLRFIAAVGVVLFHVNGKPGNWMGNLYLCVDLFFILSGFVLEPAFPKKRNINDALFFVSKRYIRLAPMLFSTLLFSFIYELAIALKNLVSGGANEQNINLSLNSVVFSILLLQIFSSQAILLNYPMWSLSTEWIVNLFLVLPLSSNSSKRNICILFSMGTLIQVTAILYPIPEIFIQISRGLSGIVLGVSLRKIFENRSIHYRNSFLIMSIIISSVWIYFASSFNQNLAPLFCLIPFSIFIFSLAKLELSKAIRILEPVANLAAILSFGIYAWHVPLAGIVEKFSPESLNSNTGSRLFALTATSCVVGYMVSKYFEKPIQRYLHNLIKIKLG